MIAQIVLPTCLYTGVINPMNIMRIFLSLSLLCSISTASHLTAMEFNTSQVVPKAAILGMGLGLGCYGAYIAQRGEKSPADAFMNINDGGSALTIAGTYIVANQLIPERVAHNSLGKGTRAAVFFGTFVLASSGKYNELTKQVPVAGKYIGACESTACCGICKQCRCRKLVSSLLVSNLVLEPLLSYGCSTIKNLVFNC